MALAANGHARDATATTRREQRLFIALRYFCSLPIYRSKPALSRLGPDRGIATSSMALDSPDLSRIRIGCLLRSKFIRWLFAGHARAFLWRPTIERPLNIWVWAKW